MIKIDLKDCTCGGTFQIQNSRERDDGIHRVRVCQNCGKRIRTLETYGPEVQKDLEIIQKAKQTEAEKIEKQRKDARDYYYKHREERKAYRKRYYEENKDYYKKKYRERYLRICEKKRQEENQ